MKQLFMWLLQKIMKITGKWISRSIFWKKHVRPQAILWTVIAQPACLHMHINACIWDLHGELPTARKLISEHGVSEFGHMACPNSDFFFFFSFFFSSFFLRVSQMSFLKLRVTRATRAFYTGEKHAWGWITRLYLPWQLGLGRFRESASWCPMSWATYLPCLYDQAAYFPHPKVKLIWIWFKLYIISWEPEGCYHYTKCMVIAPFWFSIYDGNIQNFSYTWQWWVAVPHHNKF